MLLISHRLYSSFSLRFHARSDISSSGVPPSPPLLYLLQHVPHGPSRRSHSQPPLTSATRYSELIHSFSKVFTSVLSITRNNTETVQVQYLCKNLRTLPVGGQSGARTDVPAGPVGPRVQARLSKTQYVEVTTNLANARFLLSCLATTTPNKSWGLLFAVNATTERTTKGSFALQLFILFFFFIRKETRRRTGPAKRWSCWWSRQVVARLRKVMHTVPYSVAYRTIKQSVQCRDQDLVAEQRRRNCARLPYCIVISRSPGRLLCLNIHHLIISSVPPPPLIVGRSVRDESRGRKR